MTQKILFLSLLLTLLPGSLFSSGSAVILCYHTFLSKPQFYTDFSPEEFEKQIKMLLNAGYLFVSVEDLSNPETAGSSFILITIDDGHQSVKNIENILDRYRIKPAIFVYTAVTGNKKFALQWEDLLRMKNKDWTIGSHGYYHLPLSQKLHDQSSDSFIKEIIRSKELIDQKLLTKTSLFAYPYGVYTEECFELLQKNGYTYAFTLGTKPVKIPVSTNPASYALSRIMITRLNWKQVFRDLGCKTAVIKKNKIINQKKVIIPPERAEFD